jgi:hypothetical protein
MDATRPVVTEVGRAIQAHTRAIARRIRLLKHEDEAVRSESAAALKELDPPPTWSLGEALLGTRDTDFRLRIIKVWWRWPRWTRSELRAFCARPSGNGGT